MTQSTYRTGTTAVSPVEEYLEDCQLVVVSNREPYVHEYDGDGVSVCRPAGGLTAALDPVMQDHGGTWIAWGSGDADPAVVDEHDRVDVPPEEPSYTLRRLWLDDADLEGYYYGFSNRVLWPLCHSMPSKIDYEARFWDRYRTVNERFAEAVLEEVDGEDALVWFQDYHFGFAPKVVRDRLGDEVDLAQFWHVPWPPWDVFRRCPHAAELLTGLLTNDLVGFHTDVDRRQFARCAEAMLDANYDEEAGRLDYRGREIELVTAPIGIDAEAVNERATSTDATEFWQDFAAEHDLGDVQVALGVDRLDYTKGIPERLDALERLFEEYPDLQREVTLVQKGSESRSRLDTYRELQRRVREQVDRINDRFGTDDWQPVVYTTRHLDETELAGLYHHADLALVSPVRDGLNLVAKEYVAAQGDDPGALVLSESAGVATELGDHALTVTPLDTASFADTIRRTLDATADERRNRYERLQSAVDEGGPSDWVGRCLPPLVESSPTEVSPVDVGRTNDD